MCEVQVGALCLRERGIVGICRLAIMHFQGILPEPCSGDYDVGNLLDLIDFSEWLIDTNSRSHDNFDPAKMIDWCRGQVLLSLRFA